MSPQKPEYHLLQEHQLVEGFDGYDELVERIDHPLVSDVEYSRYRRQFLCANTAEKVAERLLGGLLEVDKVGS